MEEVYITHAKRTAIGTLLGSLSYIPAPELGAHLIKNIIIESGVELTSIDEIILGQVITGGSGQNPARQALIKAGLPEQLVASNINMVCGSGLKSVALAFQAIKAGMADLAIAGGQENMSLGQHGAYIRKGAKFGEIKLQDQMQIDGLRDAFHDIAMGVTAENIARQFNISRIEQDEFAFNSHKKATYALNKGAFTNEIVPIDITVNKKNYLFSKDEGVREDINIDLLGKLKPVFVENGSVTAGNSSGINDGAACLLLCSKKTLDKYNLKPMARIVSFGQMGVDPLIMGIAAAPAARMALQKAGWSVNNLDIIELNEAFAAQAIYVNREMRWDTNKVNMNGGAIALGHPIGASGARVLVSLVHQMQTRNLRKGLATLCIGGGMGIAVCVENA